MKYEIAYWSYEKDEFGWWGIYCHLLDGRVLPWKN